MTDENERDLWRHLRITALAQVDREAAAIESAKWLFEVTGNRDLVEALTPRPKKSTD